jgi:hypothetical protein
LVYPEATALAGCEDEYMFGRDLLVAPMLSEGNRRTVQFPAGQWVNFWNGERVVGPLKQMVEVPLNEIPVYLRAGSLIPVQLNAGLQWGESMTNNRVAALVLTPPTEKTVARCWQHADSAATFIVTPTHSGFSLQIEGRAETRYLLMYGTSVGEVIVNGQPLPQLNGKEIEMQPPGWYPEGKRVIIRLPHGIQRTIQIRTGIKKD